jgi:glycosyltransferase involved in cell wall biosynthesis
MADRLKLVRLIPVLDFGGVETVFEIWSRFADRERYDLRVCTFWKDGAAAEAIRANGIPVDVLGVDPSIRNPRATIALARYLRRVRPDILQASIGEANFHAALVGKACGVPVVMIEEHGMPDRPLPSRLVHTMLYRMVDAIIGVSRIALRYVVEREYAPRERTRLLYNAIAGEFFEPVTPRPRRDVFRFVTVGRLHPMKNHDRLIQAFAPVARAHPDARLTIVGGGDLQTALAQRVAELGLERQVDLTGYRGDVKAIVETADCFVFPSLAEAFGIAAVEAMARGIPVIASSWGALPEVVGDVGADWIVDPLDVDGWSRAMQAMIALDEAPRQALGRAAREIAERYSPARHSAALYAIYDELLARAKLLPSRR